MHRKNTNLIITAGGTREYLDPVRYISNNSSGKMGIALADAAYSLGFDVTLIATFEIKKPYKTIIAQSVDEMLAALKSEFPKCTALIMAAAVSDFKPKKYSAQKIKKQKNLTLELIPCPDILSTLAKLKTLKQTVIGFALETENLLENARQKLKNKNLDYIIANEVPAIGSDSNKITILNSEGEIFYTSPLLFKDELAPIILKNIFKT